MEKWINPNSIVCKNQVVFVLVWEKLREGDRVLADITESLARHKQKTHRQKKSFTHSHTTTVTKDNKRMFIELMICFPSTIFVVDWLDPVWE